jgi:hypothetical protein
LQEILTGLSKAKLLNGNEKENDNVTSCRYGTFGNWR